MISHKCYSNPLVLIMRSKASKDSSRGFQANSEISFLISVRKILPTSCQTVDLTKKKLVWELNAPSTCVHPSRALDPLNGPPEILPFRVNPVIGCGLNEPCTVQFGTHPSDHHQVSLATTNSHEFAGKNSDISVRADKLARGRR